MLSRDHGVDFQGGYLLNWVSARGVNDVESDHWHTCSLLFHPFCSSDLDYLFYHRSLVFFEGTEEEGENACIFRLTPFEMVDKGGIDELGGDV